jgi:dienelactone hydrolase
MIGLRDIGKAYLPTFFGDKRPSKNNIKGLDKVASIAGVSYTAPNKRPQAIDNSSYDPRYSDNQIATYRDDQSKQFNVSFRGTAALHDVGTDISAVVLGKRDSNPYFQRANKVVDELQSTYPNYKINVYGHSLGGSVVNDVAKKHPQIRGYAFNEGAGIPEMLGRKNSNNVQSYRNSTDIASTFSNPTNTGNTLTDKNINSHGIDTFT